MTAENKNILRHFLTNISEGKDWCTYWEVNKNGEPAREDYRNDSAFWYNLNANLDLIYACWRLYLWTGEESYIKNPAFVNFLELTTTKYIHKWSLQADALLARPGYPNRPADFELLDNFHRCRGLASYVENVAGLRMGIDLVAALCRGFQTGSEIALLAGKTQVAAQLARKASAYRNGLDQHWWDPAAKLYNTHVTLAGKFGKGEGETFLFWFDVLQDTARISATLDHLLAGQWNVENLSYLPVIFYQYGFPEKAKAMIRYLSDPATPRRTYPEVSYGVLDGLVRGHMGIQADARYNRVETLFRDTAGTRSALSGLRVLGTAIELQQEAGRCIIRNQGNRTFSWRAGFQGWHRLVKVDGVPQHSRRQKVKMGNIVSYVDLKVAPGQKITVQLK